MYLKWLKSIYFYRTYKKGLTETWRLQLGTQNPPNKYIIMKSYKIFCEILIISNLTATFSYELRKEYKQAEKRRSSFTHINTPT